MTRLISRSWEYEDRIFEPGSGIPEWISNERFDFPFKKPHHRPSNNILIKPSGIHMTLFKLIPIKKILLGQL
jgi:hypothetical protein